MKFIAFSKWPRADKNLLFNALMDLEDNLHPLRQVGDFDQRFKKLKDIMREMEKKYYEI